VPRSTTAVRAAAPRSDHFASLCARLGFEDPDRFAPRRATILSAFEAVTHLDRSQLRTIVRAQAPRVTIRAPGQAVTLNSELRAALACLREEARQQGRLVALGQAWAGSNQLTAVITMRRPVVTEVVASAIAGEVLCRLLDDVAPRRILSREDEDLLRHPWRQAHPVRAYLRRRR
jgi:hypothetical protein